MAELLAGVGRLLDAGPQNEDGSSPRLSIRAAAALSALVLLAGCVSYRRGSL